MHEMIKNALDRLKNVWKAHGREGILFLGVFLVGVVSFEIGLVEGQSLVSKPLVVEVPASPLITPVSNTTATPIGTGKIMDDGSIARGQIVAGVQQSCTFVGSKNSNKYHLPTCSFAKRIKPANRVCFASEEDAKSKGYIAGCVK